MNKLCVKKFCCLFVLVVCAPIFSCFALVGPQATTYYKGNASQKSVDFIREVEIEKDFDQLLLLMQKRLAVMYEVARVKWQYQLPIEDPVREAQILGALVKQAHQQGLDEFWVVKFFQAQFDAAKEIQRQEFARWSERDSVDPARKAMRLTHVRPYIDQINQEMIVLIKKICEKDHDITNSGLLVQNPLSTRRIDFIPKSVWDIATAPFSQK